MVPAGLTPAQFVQRWAGRELTERASAQAHFIDLCRMLGVPTPTDNRVTDSDYGFEAKTDLSASSVYATRTGEDGALFYCVETGAGPGFADVWKRKHFAWEYKRRGKHSTLDAALAQLRIYSASLGNPPLLIVCDIDRFEIHTNFTNYPTTTYRFHITELANPSEEWRKANPRISPLEVLRKVFDDVEWFKPAKTREAITQEFATAIGKLAIALRESGNDPHAVAHLIMQIVFCFFAEDIGLLPRGLFADLIEKSHANPAQFPQKARALFKAMEFGGHFGSDTIEWFNGGLFKDVERDPTIHIDAPWLGQLLMIAKKDWDAVDPSIFGTLFERSLDPGKRSQIGAHYTSRDDIMLIVEPVVMQPLRRQWLHVQKDVAEWLEQRLQEKVSAQKQRNLSKRIEDAITAFVDHLGSVKILDPACGSGNFLYVTIQQLLELENEVRAFAARPEINVAFLPRVQPRQLMGIDVNDYACELARVSIWIGYLQWLHANGSSKRTPPILDPLDTIEHRDAILKWADENGKALAVWQPGAKCLGRAEWPTADFIIGNPPFLGSKLFRKWGLSDPYLNGLSINFDLPDTSDLCCYWFEVTRALFALRPNLRAGLLATQGIRGKENRTVIERIKSHGDIFFAWSDRDWILEGAAVRVSMIGFDAGLEQSRFLDGVPVHTIHVDLTSGTDLSGSNRLRENRGVGFIGDAKKAKFELEHEEAFKLLVAKGNPNRKPNSDVLRPWISGEDLTGRMRGMWIVDFGESMSESDASKYEAPFEFVKAHVKPFRALVRNRLERQRWWLHARPAADCRRAIWRGDRFIATSNVAKHLMFSYVSPPILPSHSTTAFGRSDDFFLGALQSSMHVLWALAHGTQLESRPRYTPSNCFETFPLPWPPGEEPVDDPRYQAIASAAKELNELRENWLNPAEWIKPIEDAVDRFEDFSGIPDEARPLLRQSAIMARAAKDPRLKKRTLTNLYNERPGWLRLAHRKLDEAVLAAYAAVDPAAPQSWDPTWAEAYEPFGAGEITIIRKGKKPDPPELTAAKEAAIAQRKLIDDKILGDLLRLNQERARAQSSSRQTTSVNHEGDGGSQSKGRPTRQTKTR